MDKAGINDAKKMSNPSYISKMQRDSMPKMPNFSMPKISTPKF